MGFKLIEDTGELRHSYMEDTRQILPVYNPRSFA